MKTVKYDKEGLIIGFDSLQFDPISTQKRAYKLARKSNTIEKINKLRIEIIDINDPTKRAPAILKLMSLQKEAEAEFKKLYDGNPVFFGPRKNEMILTPEMEKQIKKGEKLKIEV